MTNVPRWRRYLRFWRPDPECDVDDELRTHLELRMADLVRRGLTPGDAERQTLEEFGDLEATRARLHEIGRRATRRQAGRTWIDAAVADLRYTLRALRSTPVFTTAVVLTLAIGIGAMTAMYAIMRDLLLRPPPHVVAPQRMVKLFFTFESAVDDAATGDVTSYSFLELARERDSASYEAVAYHTSPELPIGQGREGELTRATLVSAGFWRTLGVQPAFGRFITDDEAHPATGDRVAVLSHALWKRRYRGDAGVLGRTLHVRGVPYTIIGVAPRGFRGTELADTDLWLPLRAYADDGRSAPTWHRRMTYNLQMVARLRPGFSRPSAEKRASSLYSTMTATQAARFFASRPDARPRWGVRMGPVTGALGADMAEIPEARVSRWLVIVAGLLLAVACANVSGLLLLRALRRRREIAVRLALGMSRRRLAAMLFTESLVLSALGGVAAALLVMVTGGWVRRVLLDGMITESARTDWTLASVSAGCTLAAALAAGLAPLLQIRGHGTAALSDGAQHGATRRSTLFRSLLIAQTALSVVLLIGAGLLVRSVQRISALDHGMDVRNVLAVRADLTRSDRMLEDRAAFFERALDRVRSLPGVSRASIAQNVPLGLASAASFRVAGSTEPVQPGGGAPLVNDVGDEFLAATGMRIVDGRDFTAADRTGPRTAVLNESLARYIWPGQRAVGQCIYMTSQPEQCVPVIGVVADARSFGTLREEQRPWFYLPLRPDARVTRVLLARIAPNVRGVEESIRRTFLELDPTLVHLDIRRLGDALDPEMRPWRLGATVFTAFGALAALLAAIGLYAAVAYAVTQRTREIGIRIAVGAKGRQVMGMVLGDGCRTALGGVVLGLGIGLALAPTIADLLFDVSPRDPVVLTVVGAGALLVALAASIPPARRAARIDPMTALRTD